MLKCHACRRRMFFRTRTVRNLSRHQTYVFHKRCRDPWLRDWTRDGDNSTLYVDR